MPELLGSSEVLLNVEVQESARQFFTADAWLVVESTLKAYTGSLTLFIRNLLMQSTFMQVTTCTCVYICSICANIATL